MSDGLEFTGERFTPECVREIWYEHVHRYVFARAFVDGLRVLDAACGEGYGSALLAERAASVTGVDISEDAIAHARARYAAANLAFEVADGTALPFDDDAFDCVVSFETLEHLHDQKGLLGEFRRVLKPGGFLLISTPDKAVYTDRQQNDNAFHVAELYRGEFEDLLGDYFPAVRLWGHKLMFHSAIWALTDPSADGAVLHQAQDGTIDAAARPAHDPVYLLAFCAADEGALPDATAALWLFDDAAESVYAHYYHEIRKNMAAGEVLAQREREIRRLERELEAARRPWWQRLTRRGGTER
ncbi:MAG: class I SAM-dependent methyltransferase [Xanthomonadales bacterium]